MGVLLSDVILPIWNQNSVVQCLTMSANNPLTKKKGARGTHRKSVGAKTQCNSHRFNNAHMQAYQ